MSTEEQARRADQAAPMTSRGASRRRLTKAGLGAAGVLWTAKSHAIDFACVSDSAALSGGLDSNKADSGFVVCEGRSPGYWKNHGGWPVPPSMLFSSVFNCPNTFSSTYGSATLLAMVEGCDFDKQNIGKHLTAAYLNVKSGKIGFLSEDTLKQMWYQLRNTGHYQPVRNVFWDVEKTKEYLEGTYKGERD